MRKKIDRQNRLRVITGGLHCELSFGPLRIVASPEKSRPFMVDAIAFEEDTFLIMSADPMICEPAQHPIRLMTELINARPVPVGSVLVKGNHPLRFLAIVHDVNQDPTWKEEWVASALNKIFQEAELRRLEAVGLPLLGTLHGKLEKKRFAVLLSRALMRTSFLYLRRLWLIAPVGVNLDIITMLKSALNSQ
jgi:hypothetical protein